jgi:hypothetical protein
MILIAVFRGGTAHLRYGHRVNAGRHPADR